MAEISSTLKRFIEHGIRFSDTKRLWAVGACPFCGKAKHFHVHQEDGNWKCHRCGESGGFLDFLAKRHQQYLQWADDKALSRLAKHRSTTVKTLKRWKVGYDPTSDMFMIPMFKRKKIVNIHRFSPQSSKCWGTSTCSNVLMHPSPLSSGKRVWICEGEWDAMVLDSVLRRTKTKGTVPVAVPGAHAWTDRSSVDEMRGKHVVLAYDHDKAGFKGERQARKVLGSSCKTLSSVHWPKKSKAGFDIRDLWKKCKRKPNLFLARLKRLVKEKPRKIPKAMDDEAKPPNEREKQSDELEKQDRITGRGVSRRKALQLYRKWLYLPDPEVLDVVFGVALANRLDGEPLWVFIVGPPSCGKSEILMSLSESPLVRKMTTTTPRALISGHDLIGGEDPSLIPRWNNKVVTIKDFTTILAMHPIAREEIFGILRDAYDGHIEKPFGNGVVRSYDSKFGILAGVTSVIERYNAMHSVVGERFLKYYVQHSTGRLLAGEKIIDQSLANLNKETTMRSDLLKASRLVLNRPVKRADLPRIPDHILKLFRNLAQWAEAMRGAVIRDKYTRDLEFKPSIAVGARISKQFAKLALGIAMFRGKPAVTFDEFQICARVARDSAPDMVEELVRLMYVNRRNKWTSTKELCEWTRFPSQTVSRILENLRILRVVQREKGETGMGYRWRVGNTMRQIMQPLSLYTKETQWRR